MLAYRGPDGGTHHETIPNTRRRKKSTGELFQKGYRVRMGHGQVADKEDQDSIWYSFGACFHVISYWGKTCGDVGNEGGNLSAKADRWRVQKSFGLSLCVSWSRFRFRICSILCSPSGKRWLEMKKTKQKRALAQHTHTTLCTSVYEKWFIYIYIFPAEWLPCNVFDLCHLAFKQNLSRRRSLSAPLAHTEMDFTWLLAVGWGGFELLMHQHCSGFFFFISDIWLFFFFNSGGRFLLRNAPKQWRLTIK